MAYPDHLISRAHKRITRRTGDITVSTVANTWEELAAEPGGPGTGGLDLTLAQVEAGDDVEVWLVAMLSGAAVTSYLDVRTMVGGLPITSVASEAAAVATVPPHSSWYAEASRTITLGPPKILTLGAADIVDGAVTLRPYIANSATTARVVYAGTNYDFTFAARVLGPAQAN